MSLPLLIGLLLQGIAIVLVARKIRHRGLAYNGLLFIGASVLYHGIGESLQRMFPGAATYRQHVDTAVVDRWVLIAAAGIFLFAVAYCYRVVPLTDEELEAPPAPRTPLVNNRWMLPAVLLAHASVSLGFVTPGGSVWQSLVIEFLPALSAVALLEFSDETNGRHSVVILALLCLVGALSGQRGAVLLTLLLAVSVLVRDGWNLPGRLLRLTAVGAGILALLISATRVDVGREEFRDLGVLERIDALGRGFERLVLHGPADTLLDDFVYRVDGNTFGALVLAGYESGIPPGGWRSFSNNLYLAIPSAFNPAKLEQGTLRLDEEDFLMLHFGMPGSSEMGDLASIDYLPSFWGVLLADVGVLGTLVCAPLLGWAFAIADSRCVRTREFEWVLVGYWLTASSITIEQGFRQFFTLGRSALLLALVAAVWGAIRRRREGEA